MTVKELIIKLLNAPRDKEAAVYDGDKYYLVGDCCNGIIYPKGEWERRGVKHDE